MAFIGLVLLFLNDSYDSMSYALHYIWAFAFLFVHIPSTALLLLVSVITYLIKRVFWSLFKIEYYFLFVSLSPFVIGWFMYVVVPYLK